MISSFDGQARRGVESVVHFAGSVPPLIPVAESLMRPLRDRTTRDETRAGGGGGEGDEGARICGRGGPFALVFRPSRTALPFRPACGRHRHLAWRTEAED